MSSEGLTAPRRKTLQAILALSGNRCAWPDCSRVYFDPSSETVVGEVAHIRARNAGGPRYDPLLSNEALHGVGNLMVLCREHHRIVDQNPDDYPVELLLRWKASAEEGPAEADDQTILAALAQLSDGQGRILAGVDALVLAQRSARRPVLAIVGTGGTQTESAFQPNWELQQVGEPVVAEFAYRFRGHRIRQNDPGGDWRLNRFGPRGTCTLTGHFDFTRQPEQLDDWGLAANEIGLEVRVDVDGGFNVARFRRPFHIAEHPGKRHVEVEAAVLSMEWL